MLDGDWIYLRRFWRDEARVADAVVSRFGSLPVPTDLDIELDRLFPRDGDGPDWQKIACAIAIRGAFAVVTGGPGTGKTTTVVRVLGLLQALAHREGLPRLRIRLAAPTGKAAARLNASIAGQIERLDVEAAVKQAIPAEVTTLHRLLGSRPDSRAFRHDRDNPLHVDTKATVFMPPCAEAACCCAAPFPPPTIAMATAVRKAARNSGRGRCRRL